MRTIFSMLDDAVRRFGDSPCSFRKEESGWKALSFAQTREDAQAVARALLSLGIPSGGAMALIAEGSPEWIVAEYSTLYAGRTCVPLSFRLLPEEIPFRINHSGSMVVFVSRISLDAVLQVYGSLETHPLLVYLDADEEFFHRRLQEAGLTALELPEYDPGDGATLRHRNEVSHLDSCGVTYERLRNLGRVIVSTLVTAHVQAAREDDVVTISYTSGTTGNPKGIMLTHLNYFANCRDALEAFNIPPHYTTLIILPCDHSFAHTVGIFAGLVAGISLYFVDSRGGGMGILRNIPVNLLETAPDFLLTVPAISGNFMKKIITGVEEKGRFVEGIFKRGIEAGIAYHGDCWNKPPFTTRFRSYFPYKLADLLVFRRVREIFGRNIKFCVGGGALLEIGQQRFFKALGIPVYQGYGLTEAAPVISTNAPGAHKLGSSGRLLPNLECRIVGETGSELPPGELGQIVIRGENVMKGYFHNAEETARTIRDGWLYTGDRGFFDADGFLIVTGREKALLIAEDGEKYSPEEIEEAIMVAADAAIHQVMLYNDHRKYTCALIVPDRDVVRRRLRDASGGTDLVNLMEGALKSFRGNPELKARFPKQWVPTTFGIVAEPFSLQNGLMNSTSKVVRYKVEERYRDLIEYLYTSEGGIPMNPRNLAAAAELLSPSETSP